MAWYAKHCTLVAAATATEARQDGSVRLVVDEVEASVAAEDSELVKQRVKFAPQCPVVRALPSEIARRPRSGYAEKPAAGGAYVAALFVAM